MYNIRSKKLINMAVYRTRPHPFAQVVEAGSFQQA